jgi:hypothetical protein
MGGNINTIKKDTEALIYARKEVGLEVNRKQSICSFLTIRMQEKIITVYK